VSTGRLLVPFLTLCSSSVPFAVSVVRVLAAKEARERERAAAECRRRGRLGGARLSRSFLHLAPASTRAKDLPCASMPLSGHCTRSHTDRALLPSPPSPSPFPASPPPQHAPDSPSLAPSPPPAHKLDPLTPHHTLSSTDSVRPSPSSSVARARGMTGPGSVGRCRRSRHRGGARAWASPAAARESGAVSEIGERGAARLASRRHGSGTRARAAGR